MTNPLIQAVRSSFGPRIKTILMQPARYPRLSGLVYPLVWRLAAYRGVDPVFLARADAIRVETRSDLTAIRFLRVWMGLIAAKGIASVFYDMPAYLATDAEKTLAHQVLTTRLGQPVGADQKALITVNLQRLDGVDFLSAPARDLASQMVAKSIADYRSRGHKSRDKHFTDTDARAALLDLRTRFDAVNKRFFLDRGTLLGAVREGGFISTDYDIDLGVMADDISLDEIETLLSTSTFALIQKNPWKLAYVSDRGIQVDFFLTKRAGDTFISRGEAEVHQWNFDPFDLVEMDFLGLSFFVPQNAEHQLAQTYGNWQTPTLFYDLSFDEPCITYGRNINAMMYLVSRLDKALKARDRFLTESCLKALKDDFGVDYTHLLRQESNKII